MCSYMLDKRRRCCFLSLPRARDPPITQVLQTKTRGCFIFPLLVEYCFLRIVFFYLIFLINVFSLILLLDLLLIMLSHFFDINYKFNRLVNLIYLRFFYDLFYSLCTMLFQPRVLTIMFNGLIRVNSGCFLCFFLIISPQFFYFNLFFKVYNFRILFSTINKLINYCPIE